MCSNSLICGCNSPVNDAIGSLKHLHVINSIQNVAFNMSET